MRYIQITRIRGPRDGGNMKTAAATGVIVGLIVGILFGGAQSVTGLKFGVSIDKFTGHFEGGSRVLFTVLAIAVFVVVVVVLAREGWTRKEVILLAIVVLLFSVIAYQSGWFSGAWNGVINITTLWLILLFLVPVVLTVVSVMIAKGLRSAGKSIADTVD
ncbi:TPA: hypothetical protein DEW05_00335 [Candidatus Saccharibacteria bacterium]|nr:hypothetical protein [Candidatus Saccharibacteria bacterium]